MARFLGWYDDTPNKPPTQKIAEGCAAFTARFGTAPRVVLVNARDLPTEPPPDLRIEVRTSMQPNTFFIGMD